MQDILLEKNEDGIYDFSIENGDFKLTSGLDTAILMSYFTDKRASQDQVADPTQRRGWVGNELNDNVEYEIGSLLWLLDQSRVNTDTANEGEAFIVDGNNWLIDDGLVSKIETSSTQEFEEITFNVIYTTPDGSTLSTSFNLWDNTLLIK